MEIVGIKKIRRANTRFAIKKIKNVYPVYRQNDFVQKEQFSNLSYLL